MIKIGTLLLLIFLTVCLQLQAQESRLHAEFKKELKNFKKGCSKFSAKSFLSCGEVVFLGHPLHLAVGSLAPQNGFSFGPAFIYDWTPSENWRIKVNTDAVVSNNKSWRTGAYVRFIKSSNQLPHETTGGSASSHTSGIMPENPVVNLVLQNISLKQLFFFGPDGGDTFATNRSLFSMKEGIFGANTVWPLSQRFNLSFVGDANGRFVSTTGQADNPIQTRTFLTESSRFVQLGEGLRLSHSLFKNRIRLNYSLLYEQYFNRSNFTFQRLTVDLKHEIPWYKEQREQQFVKEPSNGPDECSADLDTMECPSIKTRNREGTIGFRLMTSEAFTKGENTVPFYLQKTLGGSDIDGNIALPSFQDYRFRGPHLFLLQTYVEHSIYSVIGGHFGVDIGKTQFTKSGLLNFSDLEHSYSAGITIRAGGFPQIWFLQSWGKEGRHTIILMNPILLGGSSRPSLQ